jgi:glucokinase
MRRLVADIGGTHCRLAIAELGDGLPRLGAVKRYQNRDFPRLEAILDDFLDPPAALDSARFAVAGPTDGRRVRFTNLDWSIDTVQLAERAGLPDFALLNDFVAVGYGLAALGAAD